MYVERTVTVLLCVMSGVSAVECLVFWPGDEGLPLVVSVEVAFLAVSFALCFGECLG